VLRIAPERRRRGDVVAAVAIVVVLLTAALLYWFTSAAATTRSVTADPAMFPSPPAAPATVPAGFAPAWQQPSAATPVPLVAGPAVVTADADSVVGRDAATGAERWSYIRDAELCTAAGGFGHVLALYRNGDGRNCSELTSLDPASGARGPQSNPDARPGVRLLSNGTLVAATGADYVEVMRSDLVRTTEYGTVETPEQPNRQPRPGCAFGSFAMAPGRLAVIERCTTGGGDDRLTVVRPDGGSDASNPDVVFSMPLRGPHHQLVAVSSDRVVLAAPDPARLEIVDGDGGQVTDLPLGVPDAELTADPPDGAPRTSADERRIYWWSGSRTVALDRTDLVPVWSLPGTLGPAVRYADALLVPVPGGLQVVDPARGAVTRTIRVDRRPWTGPVALATAGAMLLEQRGATLTALRPA
jgi:hypothetical protein